MHLAAQPSTRSSTRYRRRKSISILCLVRQIAQRLGHSTATLHKYCPDLCQAIVMRYRWSSTGNDALIRMKQALEDALVSDKRMSLKAIAQQLGCTTAVLYKRFPISLRLSLRDIEENGLTRSRSDNSCKIC